MSTAVAEAPTIAPDTKSEFDKLMEMPASFEKLQEAASFCSEEKLAGMDAMKRAFTLAKGVQLMRKLLDKQAMAVFMSLMDTGLGFRTDHGPGCKDKNGKQLPPYTEDVVRDCLIDAFIKNLHATGNQFNIIARRMYITKEGFTKKIKDLRNVSDVKVNLAVPKMVGQGAIVAAQIEWNQDGVKQVLIRDIPVKVNQYMGTDAILGKAERKIKAAAYAQMTGSDPLPEGDVDDALQSGGEAEVKASLVDRVRGATQTPATEAAPTWQQLVIDYARHKDIKDEESKIYLEQDAQEEFDKKLVDLNAEELKALRASHIRVDQKQPTNNNGQRARIQ